MADQISLSTVTLNAATFPTPPSYTDKDSSRLGEACNELESLFIYYLLKEMRATVPKSGLISGGRTEEMYTSMLDLQLAKEMAAKGDIGISSALLGQLDNKDKHNKNDTKAGGSQNENYR